MSKVYLKLSNNITFLTIPHFFQPSLAFSSEAYSTCLIAELSLSGMSLNPCAGSVQVMTYMGWRWGWKLRRNRKRSFWKLHCTIPCIHIWSTCVCASIGPGVGLAVTVSARHLYEYAKRMERVGRSRRVRWRCRITFTENPIQWTGKSIHVLSVYRLVDTISFRACGCDWAGYRHNVKANERRRGQGGK